MGVWRENGSGSLVANRAIEFDMRWSSYDIDGFGDGSGPIPLDDMTVIEWDGIPDSNSIEIQTGYYIQRIGDYLPSDVYGVFVNSNTVADSNPITMYGSPSGSYSSIPDTYTAETSIVNNDSWLVSYIGDELDYSVNALLSVKGSLPMSASVTVSEGLWAPVVGLNGAILMHTPLVAYKADSGGGGGGTEPNPPDSGGEEGGSGHYGMVEGAVYEIVGGTARVNGAGCEIADGRARTGGAWYELNFGGTQSGEGGDIGGDDTELTTGVLFEGGSLAAPIQYQVVNATNAAVNISPTAGIEDDYIFTNCGQGQIVTGQTVVYPPIPIVAQIGPVDLSGFSTLHMIVSANGSVILGYGNTLATANSHNLTDYVTSPNVDINTKVELTVDIGSVSGEQYIKFYAANPNTTARAYKIWLT